MVQCTRNQERRTPTTNQKGEQTMKLSISINHDYTTRIQTNWIKSAIDEFKFYYGNVETVYDLFREAIAEQLPENVNESLRDARRAFNEKNAIVKITAMPYGSNKPGVTSFNFEISLFPEYENPVKVWFYVDSDGEFDTRWLHMYGNKWNRMYDVKIYGITFDLNRPEKSKSESTTESKSESTTESKS